MDDLAYSIAFPVATMLARGKLGAAELTKAVFDDADILRVSLAVNLIDDDEMTALSIEKRWASVTPVLRDGRVLSFEPRTPREDTDLQLSNAEISSKFHSLSDDVLGSGRALDAENLSRSFDQLDAPTFATLLGQCLSNT